MNELLTLREAALYLKYNKEVVRRWAKAGKLKGYQVSGRNDWRFYQSDLDAFITQRTITPQPQFNTPVYAG